MLPFDLSFSAPQTEILAWPDTATVPPPPTATVAPASVQPVTPPSPTPGAVLQPVGLTPLAIGGEPVLDRFAIKVRLRFSVRRWHVCTCGCIVARRVIFAMPRKILKHSVRVFLEFGDVVVVADCMRVRATSSGRQRRGYHMCV